LRPIAERPIAARCIPKRLVSAPAIPAARVRRPLFVVATPELLALEPRAFLVARDLILRARIHMIAAGPPRGLAVARPRSPLVQLRPRFLL